MDAIEGATTTASTRVRSTARVRRGSRLRRVVALLLAALTLVAVRPASASAADPWWTSSSAKWFDGLISYSSVINCPSMIFGSPYYENGVGAFASYAADPDNGRPAVGDTTFIKYSIYGMGMPCAGGTYFAPTFYLPAGMTFDTSLPITCTLFRNNVNNVVQSPSPGCPGWDKVFPAGGNAFKYFNNEGGDTGSLWGVVQGQHWTFQLPVKVSQPLSGAALQMHLTLADGNFNPNLLVEVPIYVFGAGQPPGVMYKQPSSVDVPGELYGVQSQFEAVVNRQGGSAGFQISTDPSFSTAVGSHFWNFAANPEWEGIRVTTGWNRAETAGSTLPDLQPGVTYYWRGVVALTGKPTMYGAPQQLRLKSGGGVDTSGTLTPGGSAAPGQPGSGNVGGATITPVPVPGTGGPTPSAPAATLAVTAPAKASAAKGVAVKVTCSAACAGKVRVVVSKKVAKQLRLRSVVLGTRRVSLKAGATTTVKVTLSKAARQAIARKGKAKAQVKVNVTSGGKALASQRAVTLKK
jgi:hypothetical protein